MYLREILLRKYSSPICIFMLVLQSDYVYAGKTRYCDKLGKDVSFSLATKKDISEIIEMYQSRSSLDKVLLLSYPEKDVGPIFEKAVLEHQIYIAREEVTKKPISYLKLYVMDRYQVEKMRTEELEPAIKPDRQLVRNLEYSKSDGQKGKPLYNHLSNASESVPKTSSSVSFTLNPERQVFIYYGSHLTEESARGKGIGTLLLEYAFEEIQKEVVAQSKYSQIKEINLVYGQSAPNLNNQSMVFLFSNAMNKIFDAQGTFSHLAYFAYQPSWVDIPGIGSRCVIIPDPEKAGAIHIVIYPIRSS